MGVLYLLAGLLIGGTLGVTVTCLCVMAGAEDRHRE